MVPESKQITRSFLAWMAANLLGFLCIPALLLVLPALKFIPGLITAIAILSLPVSLAQWLVLRHILHISPLWVLTLPAGALLAWLLLALAAASVLRVVNDESLVTLTVMYVIIGAALGLPQWLILRRRFAHALLWVAGSALGLGLGFGLVLASDLINLAESLAYIAVALIYCALTGCVLAWLMRGKAQNEYQQSLE